MLQRSKNLSVAAACAGMDEKTARKYRDLGKLPSEVKVEHSWRTRPDPFRDVWGEVKKKLENNPGLEAMTLFAYLQREYPGRYSDGQLRTLQRHIRQWRALEGPSKEVFFPQEHYPGELCQSDFTHLSSLGITLAGRPFKHLLYHFVLTYSNWETGSVCYSESFESLSEGLQNALWELGGVPQDHRTDRLTVAVNKTTNPEEFTARYRALLNHYELNGRKIQAGKPNENGDVEQRHYRFKRALDQALILRGSRDFESVREYGAFLKQLFGQLNRGRRERFQEELEVLHSLPGRRLESCKRLQVKVGPSSTIRVNHNVYSVNSRLIGERVDIRLYIDHLEVWYAQRRVEKIPRLRGESRHRINYRHVIDWLVRKPGAFENYRYRQDLFPSTHFRLAYDLLKKTVPSRFHKEYLKILHLAARESESLVESAIRHLLEAGEPIIYESVAQLVKAGNPDQRTAVQDVLIPAVDLGLYDRLLHREVGP